MKKIFFIAKNELYSLFYSPIAWILMIIFLILTNADYIATLDRLVGVFERGGPNLAHLKNLTAALTSSPMSGFLPGVIRNLYLFFPLITMGLISREVGNGTIKLLYSSPLKIREIVLGKYLAIVTFTLCLIGLLLITMVSLSLCIINPDYIQILASLFGLFLVLATYAAIGLFISSLTSYQIVAAIITLAIFAFLSQVGGLWQEIDFVRNITYYLNIGGRAGNFINGLLNLRDFTYFMILISSFLLFTIIRIKSATESISKFRKALRYVAVIAGAFLLGYITNKPQVNVYFDATRGKIHTITPPTQAVLARLNDGELEITAYANLLNSYYAFAPSQQLSIEAGVWEKYIRFKPDINLKYVYYYNIDTNAYPFKVNPGKTLKEIAEKEVKSYRLTLDRFLSPERVSKLVNIKAEENRCFFVMKYKGKTAIVRTFDDMQFWPSENEISATINRLISTPPKFAFLSDEIERGPFSERVRDYKLISSQLGNRYAPINQGYDFDTVSLRRSEIPANLAALVISDPRTPFTPEGLEKINKYVDGGGNLFMTTEPDRREISKPVLEKLGLSLREGMIIQPDKKLSSDIAFTLLTDTAAKISPQFNRQITNDRKYYGDPLFRVAMAGASAMDYQEKDGFHIYPLLRTDSALSWNRVAPISNDSLQLPASKLASDEHGSFVTAVRMNRVINGKQQRIIVASDADYLTKPQFDGWEPKRYNYNFGFWCFSYFTYGQFPANTLRPESIDDAFKIGASNIPFQKLLFYWIIPALVGIWASIILIRRKRK
jgi:ABC-2 type transport system permease protein